MNQLLKEQIDREVHQLVTSAESNLKTARHRFSLIENEFHAAKRELEIAEVRMAAAVAIQGAATTHIVLQDLKEGNLED